MKHFQIANVIISIAICFIVFFNIAVFVLVYIIWMFAYIFVILLRLSLISLKKCGPAPTVLRKMSSTKS